MKYFCIASAMYFGAQFLRPTFSSDNDDAFDDIETVAAPREYNEFAERDNNIPLEIRQQGEAAMIEYDKTHQTDIYSNKNDMAMLDNANKGYSNDAVNTYDAMYNNKTSIIGKEKQLSAMQQKMTTLKHFPELKEKIDRHGRVYGNNIISRSHLIKGDHQFNNGSLKMYENISDKLDNAKTDKDFYKIQAEMLETKEEPVLTAYPDSKDYVTIGTGYNMDKPGARKEWNTIFDNKLDFDEYHDAKKSLTKEQAAHLFASTAGETGTYTKGLIKEVERAGADINNMSMHHRMGLTIMHYQASGLLSANKKEMGKAFRVMCDPTKSDKEKNEAAINGPGKLFENYIYNKSNDENRNKPADIILEGVSLVVSSFFGQDKISPETFMQDIQHRMRAHGNATKEVNIIAMGNTPITMEQLLKNLGDLDYDGGKELNIYTPSGEHIHAKDGYLTYSNVALRSDKTLKVSSIKAP